MSLHAEACIQGPKMQRLCTAEVLPSASVCTQGRMASFLHLHTELQVAVFDMLDITDRCAQCLDFPTLPVLRS